MQTTVVPRKVSKAQSLLAGTYPKIMGILNVTPDSFYDGGFYFKADVAVARARQMVEQGVDIIDIGGESTRPFAEPVSIQQECDRVLSVIETLKKEIDIPLSLDSRRAPVIDAALKLGVDMINDVSALQDPQSLKLVADAQVPVCLMHMQADPSTMQVKPAYDDVLREVGDFLQARIAACLAAGITQENICIDPGFGFGKTLSHNLTLLANLSYFTRLNCPVLVGLSRKSMFNDLLQRAPEDRLFATLSASSVAAMQANVILRTHDVAATYDLAQVIKAIKENTQPCR
jgi:dihydropteroate synthase